jgi:hypothetical protein
MISTINELILTCAMLVNGIGIEHDVVYPSVYNNSLVEINMGAMESKKDRIRACVEIGELAIKSNIDPSMAIAIAKHESKFIRKIVGGLDRSALKKHEITGSPSLGIMQVIPKWWCKLQTGREDWDSKTDVLYIPKTQRSCKKKKKQNHYFNEDCENIYCDKENCDFIECDLEQAGIIALSTYINIFKKDAIQVLCHYNYGNTNKACPSKSIKYANSIISDMGKINTFNKRLNKKSKWYIYFMLMVSNAPLELMLDSSN